MKIQVRSYGKIAEMIGTDVIIDNVSNTDELLKLLRQKFPELVHATFATAINSKIIEQNTILSDNAVVALLPPFSGG